MKTSIKRYSILIGIFLMVFVAQSQTPTGFQWIVSHGDGISANPEWVRDIEVDQAGNIYVAGTVNDQFVRDSTGTIIKSIQYFPFDSISNHGRRDIWLAKYNPQGNLLWHRYAGGGSDDYYYDMVADQNGNCYIAGHLLDHNTRSPHSIGKVPIGRLNRGTFIAKVNSNGSLVWHRSFGGDTLGTFMTPYFAGVINLTLENNKIKAYIGGGGDHVFGYQTLYGRDSLDNGVHEISYDLNGNYIEAKSFPFPRFDRLPNWASIQANSNGAFMVGTIDSDTVLVGSDTILKNSVNDAFVFAFDTNLNHVNTFHSNNTFDQFHDAQLVGDTLVVAGHFNVFVNRTVNFDTISHTANPNDGQAGGIFLFDAKTNRLEGLYPSTSLAPTVATLSITSSHASNLSFGIGGLFNHKTTFTGTSNYIEAVDHCTSCINTDLFFSLFDRSGNTIAEDVIYTSGFQNDAVLAMRLKDSILYIGGYIGDSVIIAGVDTFITNGPNDAFLAAYHVGQLSTSIEEPSGFIKADNGILAYPNPTQGQVTLMGKALNEEAQLYNISGQQVRIYRLDKNAFRQIISLDNLDSGVYFLIIIGQNEKQQVKIVKQ